jgi:formate hydrogenlyase subunit 3/multisubunit Na+/H+ antiporter MnhD subunit
MLAALILLPLGFAAIANLLPWYQGRSWLLPLAGGIHLTLAVLLVLEPGSGTEPGAWLGLDALSRLVLLLTSLLYFGCALYAADYLNLRRDRGNRVMGTPRGCSWAVALGSLGTHPARAPSGNCSVGKRFPNTWAASGASSSACFRSTAPRPPPS